MGRAASLFVTAALAQLWCLPCAASVAEQRAATAAGWQDDGRSFWYRRTAPDGGHEFRLVDIVERSDTPLCDHARLARALAAATGSETDARHLPLERPRVDLGEGWLRFRALGRRWHYNPGSDSLRVLPDDIDPEPALALIRLETTGVVEEADLRLVNLTPYPALCSWVGDGGERRQYGSVEPGQVRQQHTYPGHIWELQTPGGRVFARIEAGSGAQSVDLREPVSGPAAPWTTRVDGDDLQVQAGAGDGLILALAPDRPTGEIRVDRAEAHLAVATATPDGPTWRFYYLTGAAAERVDVLTR